MRTLLLFLYLFFITSGSYISACTYTASNPFPAALTVNAGETLCVDSDLGTTWTSIVVNNGGVIRIRNGSKFTVNGSLAVYGTGEIHIEDCNSKLWVNGSYTGVWTVCEIKIFCATCNGSNIGKFWKLQGGVEVWRGMCCQPPLAIELGLFEVVKDGVNNFVYFQTYSEFNVDYFVIQRSTNTFVWESVDTISGTNTLYPMWYSTIDHNVTASYYYRLKEIETTGKTILHPTVYVERKVVDEKELYRVNTLGQYVDATYKGLVFIRYSTGRVARIVQ
jgi:hypothetical protein